MGIILVASGGRISGISTMYLMSDSNQRIQLIGDTFHRAQCSFTAPKLVTTPHLNLSCHARKILVERYMFTDNPRYLRFGDFACDNSLLLIVWLYT